MSSSPPPYSISSPINGHRCQCRCGLHLDPEYELSQPRQRLVPVQAASSSAPPSYGEASSFPTHSHSTVQTSPKDRKKDGTFGRDNSTDGSRTARPRNFSDRTIDGDGDWFTPDQELLYECETMYPSATGRGPTSSVLRCGRVLLSEVSHVTVRAVEVSLHYAGALFQWLGENCACSLCWTLVEDDPEAMRRAEKEFRRRRREEERRRRERRLMRRSLKSRLFPDLPFD